METCVGEMDIVGGAEAERLDVRPGACNVTADRPAPGAAAARTKVMPGATAASPMGTSQRLMPAAVAEAALMKADRISTEQCCTLFMFGIKMIINGNPY
jgi:hypothetical protein